MTPRHPQTPETPIGINLTEGKGHRRRHDERDPGRDQREHAHEVVIGVGRVQCPRELGPCPPDQPEQQHRAGDTAPREVRRSERGDLRDREDEHQVEEELDEGDGLVIGHGTGDESGACTHAGRLERAARQWLGESPRARLNARLNASSES